MSDVEDWWDGAKPARRKAEPMEGLAAEIAGRFKELFFAFDNRRAEDNRSAQTHLGPSEIGTECDRQIAMKVMNIPPVNPGGDGWAAFVGTQGHAGLADLFTWANLGTGRYATEMPVQLPSTHVPKGTADLLDRSLKAIIDHKFLGSSSLSKLRLDGPSSRYRVQLHCYAYGARRQGEQVDHVALVAWPREAGSLTGLHVWTEAFDEQVAVDALARVDRIAADIERWQSQNAHIPEEAWRHHPTADECRWCPHHSKAPGGCPGHNGR